MRGRRPPASPPPAAQPSVELPRAPYVSSDVDTAHGEREVLLALWDAGPATIRTLAEQLYPGASTSEYAT